MKKRNAFAGVVCSAAICANMFAAAAVPASADDVKQVTFTFTDSGITASADGYEKWIDGTALTIKDPGSYTVTGECSDGSIKVKKSLTGVTLTLCDLTLSSETTAPLACNKNSQADIIVKGSVTLSDTVKNSEDYWYDQGYTDSDSETDAAENAVVKLKGASKVTISGDGTLNIKANAKNGIKSGSTLDSDLETELAYDPSSEYFSYLTLSDLTVNIDATNVYTPQSSSDTDTSPSQDPWGGRTPGGMGGEDSVDYYGDGINAESCLNIRSGTYNITADDDALHCDYILNVGTLGADNSALDINIDKSYEGIEGAVINFYSGDIDVISSDDAVNAANKNLSSGNQFGPGSSSYNFEINIYGGDIYADASNGNDNDGLDSNGSINVYGGKTVTIADRSGNAFDLEGSFNVTGGTLLGLGTAPMEGEKLNSNTVQSWAVWSGSSGGFGGRGGFGRQSGSTNIPESDKSRVTLTVDSQSFAVGSSVSGVADGSKVAVMLDGSEELISAQAKTSASYITFAGDIYGTPERKLTYSANNGTADTSEDSAKTGETIKIAENKFENGGAAFIEWNTSADGTGVSYSAGDSFVIPCDCTLYAIWEKTDADDSDSDTPAEAAGFKGTFVIEGGEASITTYKTQDYTAGEENQTEAYSRDGTTGDPAEDGSGQINFRIVPADGYEAAEVTATEGTYKNIKTPADTGTENVYRITKITGDLTITIKLQKASSGTDTPDEPQTDSDTPTEGFKGTFVIEGGKASITTYTTHDYTTGKEDQTEAYACDDTTGDIVTDGTGQINFKVIPADGYEVADVTATKGTYKNIKTPADTGAENVYRITKITGDLTITVTLAETETDTETSDPDTDSGEIPTPPGWDDSDRPTPPGWDDSDRPTPPGWDDSDRPTPPGWDDSDRPTPPDTDNTDMPTPPDTDDSDRPTPPDTDDSDRPTPPDTDNTDMPTPPDTDDSDRPTPPDSDDKPTPDEPSPDTDKPAPPDTDDKPTPDEPSPDKPTPDEPDKPGEPDEKELFGDDNSDGEVDSADALGVLRFSVGIDEKETGSKAYIIIDVNHDGIVDSADALLILRHSVGLEDDISWAGLYKAFSEVDLSMYK